MNDHFLGSSVNALYERERYQNRTLRWYLAGMCIINLVLLVLG